MKIKELLELKKKANAKRPVFNRQEIFQRRENKGSWRKPRGIHSKMRHGFQGHGAMVEVGYRSPAAVRGLTEEGLKIKHVENEKDLEKVDVENEIVVIGKNVGNRKKYFIIKKMVDKNIKVLNNEDPASWLKKIEEELKARKENKKNKVKKASEKKLEKGKSQTDVDKGKPVQEDKSEEEKKKDFDKLLIKKEE